MSATAARTTAVAAIIAASTTASSRVYGARSSSLEAGYLPAVVVTVPRTRRESKGIGTPVYQATHTVEITCAATGANDEAAMAAAETLEEEVLTALLGGTWAAQFDRTALCETRRGRDSDAKYRLCASVISLDVVEHELFQGDGDAAADGVDVEIDFIQPTLPDDGPDDAIEAEIQIDFPQPE